MRKQFHFRPAGDAYNAWDVSRLVELYSSLPRVDVALSQITEIDEPYWFQPFNDAPTCRAVATHARLISDADLTFPILLCAEGRVMDGMHRVVKALLDGASSVSARQFPETPVPDFVGVQPEDLTLS